MQKDLAHRFKIHFLYSILGAVGIWISEEAVKAHLPDVFSEL